MFWRFGGYSNISTIDTLLDKQNLKLEDLLEETDLIQELKSHHTKLIEYLRDDDNLHALLTYVIAPGPKSPDDDEEIEKAEAEGRDEDGQLSQEEDEAEKKRLKYAYVACEILSCETWSITEALMSNTAFLTEFWDFLRRPPSLDPLQAGYFTKVNETLLEKKTEEMLDFFKSLPGILPAILQHVDCPMVMDLLLKIISLEKAEGGAGIVDWLHSQDLIPMLLSNLSPDCNSSTQTSAGDFLKAIITISANAAQDQQSCIGPNSLTRQLVSESCISTLIHAMLKGGNPLTVGVGIVIEVIRKNNSDYDPESGSTDQPPSNHDPIYLGTLLRLFAKYVPDFMALILSSKHTVTEGESTKVVDRGELKSAWGTKIEPLGFDRFKTCELMAELLHCSNMGLLNERGSEEFINARDEEREHLRLQGAFNLVKQHEDSTVDLSTNSSKFENAFTPSASTSIDELRVANSNEEDGFEKVAVTEMPDLKGSALAGKSELVDEPLSQKEKEDTTQNDIEVVLSPTTNIREGVRRLSMEDTDMISPPNELDAADRSPATGEDTISPRPNDKPPPLFATAKDPNKTPTPSSPEPPSSPKSPKSPKSGSHELGIDSQIEGDSFHSIEGSTMRIDIQAAASDEMPVVGDFLKLQFVENRTVPTILSFFFRFPWNNFLHNVVYDVVQQVFNGPMDRGYNKFLAFDLFESGSITQQIIDGQQRSDKAQEQKNMRLGYMGHLTLVAEEVVKFGERHPREMLSPKVQESIYGKDWEDYVTKTLAETRDRDNAILGGFRPAEGMVGRQAVLNAVNANAGIGPSQALVNAGIGGQGLDSIELRNQAQSGSTTSGDFSAGGSLLSGFGSSSDDDDEDMEDAEDEPAAGAVQLSAADTGITSDATGGSVPLIPPPPAPLNIEPSRARRRLADRLARHRQEQEQEVAASEFGSEADDPFAALGDDDNNDGADPFSLDEEEQDITTFGKRTNVPQNSAAETNNFSMNRNLTSLFSSGRKNNQRSGFEGSLDSSSSESGSDGEPERPALEARRSMERKPLDIDDDEEMGEMVAPTEEANSSDEEVLSPVEKEQLGQTFGGPSPGEHVSEFDGQGDEENEDDSDQLVEIALPTKSKRKSRG